MHHEATKLVRPRTIFGQGIARCEVHGHKLRWWEALGEYISDALSSAAYSIQEMLHVIGWLSGHGMLFGISLTGITMIVMAVLWLLVINYQKTLEQYKKRSAGAYVVTDDNYGRILARLVGAALQGEYILTASVSTSAGAGQLVTMFPQLGWLRLPIALFTNFLLWFINRIGIQNASRLFTVSVVSFTSTVILTGLGAVAMWMFGYEYHPLPAGEHLQHVGESVSFFLFMRAFANGCAALTGVEAVSDGVATFQDVEHAKKTMKYGAVIITCVTLSVLAATLLTGVVPKVGESLIVLLAQKVWGPGSIGEQVVGWSTYLILFAAGSVAYADYPRVLSLLARNAEMPRQFKFEGKRALVFDKGCNALFVFSSMAIVIYGANETPQIPLYSVGVFIAFGSSQFSMARRWFKSGQLALDVEVQTEGEPLKYDPSWKRMMWQCIITGGITCFVLMVIIVSKFTQGAWIMLVVVIPIFYLLQWACSKHYKHVASILRMNKPVDTTLGTEGMVRIILAGDVNEQLRRLIDASGGNQYLLHVWGSEDSRDKFLRDLQRLMPNIDSNRVFEVEAEFRDLMDPALYGVQQIEETLAQKPIVVLGELERTTGGLIAIWLHRILHMQSGRELRRHLSRHQYLTMVVPTSL